MAAVAGEVPAPGSFRFELAMFVFVVVAELEVRLEAGEVLVEDEVDDAGHGVGAPGRRGAAGHDIDALDKGRRDGGEVDAAELRARLDHALSVEEDEGPQDAEIAQIDGVDARVALGRLVAHRRTVVRRVGRADRGKLANGVADIGVGVALQLGDAHHGDRRRRLVALDGDARRGNHYRFDGGRGARRGLRPGRSGGDYRRDGQYR